MKHLKFLFPVLLCTLLLGLSSCKETNAARLRAMRGDWESVKNRPAFTLFEENGHYRVTYDKENDRILLSPGGEYKRSNQPIKK